MPRGVYERRPGMGNYGSARRLRGSIERRSAAGQSQKEIALRLGICEWTVWAVLHGREWNGPHNRIEAIKEPPQVIRAHMFTSNK